MKALKTSAPLLALALVALTPLAGQAATKHKPAKAPAKAEAAVGHAAAGAVLFKARCSVCHGQQAEGSTLAPNLHGVVGRKAASTDFPRYTPALKASGIVWSAAKLSTFLTAPSKLVPGTAMAVSIPKVDERNNVIAYLASLKK